MIAFVSGCCEKLKIIHTGTNYKYCLPFLKGRQHTVGSLRLNLTSTSVPPYPYSTVRVRVLYLLYCKSNSPLSALGYCFPP